jgi:antitoxin ParD1/3/4
MAASDLSLGAHWNRFIDKQVATGRYGSADEVIREALRALEAREAKLSILIAHLEAGDAPGDDLSLERLIEELDAELETDPPSGRRH